MAEVAAKVYRLTEFCNSEALLAGRDYDDYSYLDFDFDLLWIIQNIVNFNENVFQEPEMMLV